ncbi:MAG: serine/threonine protein kinase [Gemmatimonadetes bacterium]|nr:serine/threonine protein kinase [Gemmatimonadota bacterium]
MYGDDARFCTRDGTRLAPQASAAGAPAAPPAGAAAPRGTSARAGPAGPSPATSFSNLAGRVLDGRYRIEKKIGEGGMSFVYLATDISDKKSYAIKVLSPALSQDNNAMQRLRREAGLAIRLEHPNVCHIIRLGETEDGMVYVVMPFVQGEILADLRHKKGHIPLPQVAIWVVEIASGLHVAHELKIIHRDLKPENIMICKYDDGSEHAVVMDFGLAKERKAGGELEKLTATGIILGTPEFMSPEQLRGKPLDPRTDIYSLALMTYEMLTGKLPFTGRTQQEMMIARLRNEPIPLRTMRPELNFPPGVEKVLLKGMARGVEERYASAPEFASAFAAASSPDGEDKSGGVLGRLFGR